VRTVKLWAVANETDCLVLLQQGQVDAISTDDTILQGLAYQDPNVKILTDANQTLSDEPYGMAISKAHPEFTRFVNAVLAQERADGMWQSIWQQNLGPTLERQAPAPPPAVYRG
jgi:polar amino acid transport system substrate-binding protein